MLCSGIFIQAIIQCTWQILKSFLGGGAKSHGLTASQIPWLRSSHHDPLISSYATDVWLVEALYAEVGSSGSYCTYMTGSEFQQ